VQGKQLGAQREDLGCDLGRHLGGQPLRRRRTLGALPADGWRGADSTC
jgi:hypothetical protein